MRWIDNRAMYPIAVDELGGGSIDDVLFGCGGTAGAAAYRDTYAWTEDAWVRVADLPTSRAGHASAVVGGKLHTVGGLGSVAFGSGGGKLHYVYDPAADSWASAAVLPAPAVGLFWARACEAGGLMYVFGGAADENNAMPSTHRNGYVYDPAADSWSGPLAGMAARRNQHALVTLADGTILAAGGTDETGTTVASAEVYDPATDSWSSVASMPGALSEPFAGLLADGVHVVGGAVHYVYDPAAGSWSSLAPLLHGASDGACGVIGPGPGEPPSAQRLHVFAGTTGGAVTTYHERWTRPSGWSVGHIKFG